MFCASFLILIYLGITNEIGNISENNKIDNPYFHTKNHIYQYYQSGAKYVGERKAVRDIFNTKKFNLSSIPNGWITIRFIVNYQGITNRFRFFCISNNYRELQINKHLEQELLKAVKSLHNWEVGKFEGKKVDSYYQITLKIENAKIIDIF